MLAVVTAIPAVVVAGPAVVSGGPRGESERAHLDSALAEVARPLSVCWRGKRPKVVKVDVSVAPDGSVVDAKAKSPGKVAACAAAVLAVQSLAPAGKGYRATLSFETSGSGGGDRDAVMSALQSNAAIRACYGDRANLRGDLQVRFLVKPTGRVVDVEVVKSSVSDEGVASCLVDALAATRLAKLASGKTIEFVLPFHFDGQGGAASGGTADPALQPQKNGPLDGAILTRVMNEAKPRFSACYDKTAAKKPTLAGDVVLRYTVRADGKPYNVKIKRSTLGDSAVESCIVSVGKMLRFPKSPGRKDTKVIYPFRFARQ